MALIVVINHDSTHLRLADRTLKASGYQVLLISTSEVAYDKIKGQKPSLIVLDTGIELPDAGLRLLQKLMLDAETVPIPILLCSSEEFRRRARQLDGLARLEMLMTPYDPAELLNKVRGLLKATSREPMPPATFEDRRPPVGSTGAGEG